MKIEEFVELVRRMRQEQKSACGYMRREIEQEVDNELARLMVELKRERQKEKACNIDCVAYDHGRCPFFEDDKVNCKRFRIMNGL